MEGLRFVLNTNPVHLSKKVPLDKTIEIFFLIDLTVSSVNHDNVILYNIDTQKSEPIDIDYHNKVLSIKPKEKLKPCQHYQVQLVGGKNGICDITGRYLQDVYSVEFYTDDVDEIKPPTLLSPTDLSEVHGNVVFKWTEVEGAYYYELQISRSNIFDVLEWPVSGHRVYETEVVPDLKYEKGHYYVRIRSVSPKGTKSAFSKAIRFHYSDEVDLESDEDENPQLETLQHHFAAENDDRQFLEVIESTPQRKAANISIDRDKIVIEFSEELDPETVTNLSCYVVEERN